MSGKRKLGVEDYPLAEKRPDLVSGRRGRSLDELTIDAVMSDNVSMDDLRITGETLRHQADIARDANRPTLADNFGRAAEMVDVPQETIMRVYELLRPGRAGSRQDLLDAARMLRETYRAERLARFVEEAAEVYERRRLFTFRY